MKVGIFTFHFSDNYGALFQAYALRTWFEERGDEVEFINYHPKYVEEGGNFTFKGNFLKANLKIAFLKASKLKSKFFGNKVMKNNFKNFISNELVVTGKLYRTAEELDSSLTDYDLLVCGSDQIWNPSSQFGVDRAYFLDFEVTNSKTKKISYAPSFGKNFIEESHKKEVSKCLKALDAISVREENGIEILKSLINKVSTLVPDPTFLINDYSKIIKPLETPATEYVFCYALRSSKIIGNAAELVSKKLEVPIYSPYNQHRRWKEIGETVYPCPRQWLYLLANSKFVLTNSFHGTALSIILNKPFLTIGLTGGKNGLNDRAWNLLEQVGLSHRFISEETTQTKVNEFIEQKIDWASVNIRISEMKKSGEKFLIENILND